MHIICRSQPVECLIQADEIPDERTPVAGPAVAPSKPSLPLIGKIDKAVGQTAKHL
jgi:hypothetical protein